VITENWSDHLFDLYIFILQNERKTNYRIKLVAFMKIQLRKKNRIRKLVKPLFVVTSFVIIILGIQQQIDAETIKPNLIVSANGRGDVKTVSEAIAKVPENNKKRFVILIKRGIYDEQIRIPANKPYISLIGEDSKITRLQFNISNKVAGSTSAAYAFYIGGHDFYAEKISFENTFGKGSQAVAVVAEADRITFNKCRFIGWQDTLYAKDGRQFYKDSYIEGAVDFIFGQAAAVFENCVIHSKGDGYITAPMRFAATETSGFVFNHCKLTGENIEKGVLLGRPWRDFGRTVYLNTKMDAHIKPEGWNNWLVEREKTAYFAEYKSSGKGGNTANRVAWSHQLSKTEATQFLPTNFLKGQDGWNPYKQNFAWAEKTKPDWMLVNWGSAMRQQPLWYQTDEAARIADQLVLYQKVNGGFEKNSDLSLILTQTEKDKITSTKSNISETTIDNGTTYTQLAYLAKLITGSLQKTSPPSNHQKHLEAFFKGFDYLLSSQYANGGFPQFFPLKEGYYTHITYNDDAMIGILHFLKDIAEKKDDYKFVDEERCAKAEQSIAKGLEVLLKTQVKVDGVKTVWCAQHDEVTLEAAPARNFEPISLSGSESVGIVKYLMEIKNPSPEIINAIESAVKWFEKSKITGIQIETMPLKDSPRGFDRIVVEDKDAPPLWARFYDILTNRPIFMGRDKVAKNSLMEIEIERRTGYNYYTNQPQKLLEVDYPKWKAKLRIKN
jgi:PelA/Pel-15E family pectate lyase